jgi:hypothetical protein
MEGGRRFIKKEIIQVKLTQPLQGWGGVKHLLNDLVYMVWEGGGMSLCMDPLTKFFGYQINHPTFT